MSRFRSLRRGAGRRRVRRLTDWISGSQGFDEENSVLIGPQFFTIINLADLEQHNDRMTVCRMVGQIYFRQRKSAANDFSVICWGIYHGQSDGAGSVFPLSPSSLQDADSENWLFRRTVALVDNSAAVGSDMLNSYESAAFDTRVMRKLEGLEQLVLAVQIDFTTSPSPAFVGVWMRSLVKLT